MMGGVRSQESGGRKKKEERRRKKKEDRNKLVSPNYLKLLT